MKPVETTINIDAPPSQVWHILTHAMPRDPEKYGILRFDGSVTLGSKIKLWSEVAPKRAFALKVVRFDAPKMMIWRGGMPFGLFVGTRTFTITANGSGAAFHMKEVFSGPLAPMITKSMPDLTPSFTKFANALKQEAEKI